MVTDPYFHSAFLYLKIRMSHRRKRTWCQTDSHTPGTINSLLCSFNHFIKISTQSSPGTAAFPHKDFSCYTATHFSLIFWSACHIIIRYDCLDFYSYFLCHFYSHLHIHIIAGIIAIETCYSSSLVGTFSCRKKCCCRWRSTNLTDRRGIAHVFSHIAHKRRFMSGTSTGDHTYFVFFSTGTTYHSWILRRLYNVFMCPQKALQHFIYNMIRVIQNSLHTNTYLLLSPFPTFPEQELS